MVTKLQRSVSLALLFHLLDAVEGVPARSFRPYYPDGAGCKCRACKLVDRFAELLDETVACSADCGKCLPCRLRRVFDAVTFAHVDSGFVAPPPRR